MPHLSAYVQLNVKSHDAGIRSLGMSSELLILLAEESNLAAPMGNTSQSEVRITKKLKNGKKLKVG